MEKMEIKVWYAPLVLGLFLCASFVQANEIENMKALEAQLKKEVGTQETLSPKQVVIVNNGSSNKQEQKSEQKSEQKQETKASSESASWGTGDNIDSLRQDRRSVEQVNEQVLMEKLEQSRIEDEKSRLDRLFKVQEYNRKRKAELGETDLDKADIIARENTVKVKEEITEIIEEVPLNAPAPQLEAIVPVQPPVNYVVAPAPQALTPHITSSAANSESTLVAPPLKRAGAYDDYYFKGIMAAGAYSEVDNVNAETSWGVAIGKSLSTRTFVELQAVKAKFEVDEPRGDLRGLSQYNWSGLLGYKIGYINDKLQPHVRGGLSYVRRNSKSLSSRRFSDRVSTNAFDAILGGGVDFKISRNLSLAGTADYHFNLFNDTSSNDLRRRRAVSKIEEEDYFIIGVGLKLDF